MKKRLVLKPFVVPTLYLVFSLAVIIGLFVSIDITDKEENLTYVSETILDEYIPVVSTTSTEVLTKPFTDGSVVISNNYYDYQSTEEEQQASILYHKNTYLQNTGINYKSDNSFDVNSVLSGEVIEVEEKELLGKSVTIRHENNAISVYQCLNEVTVSKGDEVKLNQVIAKSGKCDLITDSENNLHFELYVNGIIVDPENYYDKTIE